MFDHLNRANDLYRRGPRQQIEQLLTTFKQVIVLDGIDNATSSSADLVLPTAMWVEKEGAYGNAERRTQFWHQMVDAPGESRSDLWQLVLERPRQ